MLTQPIIFIIFLTKIYAQSPPTITTPRGTLVGYHFDQGNDTTKEWYGYADVFLGIPYAIPPVGNLRYKQPRPITQFPGPSPYNATHFGKACIQPTAHVTVEQQSEDCLYVNFWTPNAATTTKYPVLVWIHGGGLITGTGWMGNSGNVRNFVSHGIVMASIDYRMGWLGFFTTFTDDFPPNLGMLDQALALKFIKEEIPYFGGDPNRITIFGQSAGGHSVSALSYSPISQNLFQQYIAESGAVLTCYEDSVGPTYRNFHMAQYTCNYTQEMWDSGNFTALKTCLMNIDAQLAQNISEKAGAWNSVCWNMVQDNYFLPGSPQTLGPKRPNNPAIIGNCKDEYSYMIMGTVKSDPNLTSFTRSNTEKRLLEQYENWFGNGTKAQQVLKIWEDHYLPPGTADDDHLAWLKLDSNVGTPAFFTWGTLRDVEYYINNKNPNVYAYEFAWSSFLNDDGYPRTDWNPVPHVCEIPYVLGYGSGGNWTVTNQNLANFIQEKWVNFVKNGNPTPDISWKPSTSTNFTAIEYFEFNNISTAKIGYRATDEFVWNQAIPQVLGDYPPNLMDNYPRYQSKVKNNVCYEAIGNPETFTNALTNCVQTSYGTLVTIGSAFENSDLLEYPDSNNSNWTWANYDTNGYRSWKSGLPSQDSNANCVVLNANDGTWANQACTTNQCYICGLMF